ncbi:MAG: CotH kinase family protein [Candidatus Nealsonbacteria bacterium]|nr:CotH kinase family protein [Candidatus Nealsonbacteria bacterium]
MRNFLRTTPRGRAASARLARAARSKLGRSNRLSFETLEQRLVLDTGPLFINEFMADNESRLKDEDGAYSDWVEIYNPGPLSADLDGWFLTDNAGDLTKWQFPDVTIEPDDYLLVFASNKDRPGTGLKGELHTNFELGAGGEYLALVEPDGLTVEHEYSPEYPQQKEDVSYGMTQENATFFMTESAQVTYLVPTLAEEPLQTVWMEIDYDDSLWAGFTQASRVMITEVGTGSPRFVEIQNASVGTVNTSGWIVAVNDAQSFKINDVHDTFWNLPSGIGPSGVLYQSGTSTDPNYWGIALPWLTHGPGWVMILDDVGNVVDFVVWGYGDASIQQFQTNVNGHDVSIADIWNGSKVPGVGSTFNSLQRIGDADHDSALDWAFREPTSMDEPNDDLETPFITKLSTAVGFDAASTGVGAAVQIDVEAEMHGQNASAWVRTPFEAEDPRLSDMLRLQMQYNDGFVAYINGVKVAEDNAPAEPLWNSTATAARSVGDSLAVVEFDISAYMDVLQAGENVLAVHGLNVSAADSDFLILPDLMRNSRHFFNRATPGSVNSQGYPAPAVPVEILTPGGTFVNSMTAEITTTANDAVIRYTLDETLPVESSPEYTGPITITTTQQLRARAFQPWQSPGPVSTETYVALGDAYMQNFTSDLPIVMLDDFGGGRPSSERPAYMAIFDTVGDRSSLTTGMDVESRIGIKIRGSSTAGRDKASYSIEAWQQEINDDIDIAPLGMPADSDWVLYGPYNFDRALIRDPFMYELSNQVGRYAVRTQFVEVFFNMDGGSLRQDNYRGVYVLMESIKRGPDRVDVANLEPGDNTEPDVTGGYIITVDRRDPGDSGFSAGGQSSLNYVDPEERNDITTAQKAYIKEYIDAFAAALNGSNFKDPDLGYAAYLNVDSAIDHNILMMLTKDPDAFRLSSYLHKDREGLLEYGPIWDFDRTMGNDDDSRALNPIGWNTNDIDFFNYSWFNRLFQDIDFQQRYTDKWQAWRQGAFSTANMDAIIDSMAAQLQEAQVRNFQKWPGSNPKGNAPFPNTYQGEIDWLKDWLQRRTTWVDEQFAPMPGISHGGGLIPGPVTVTLTVPSGTTVYYTTDGHDPRVSGGGIYAGASVYTPGSQIFVDSNTRITARSYAASGFEGLPKMTSLPEWSGPTSSTFIFEPRVDGRYVFYNDSAYDTGGPVGDDPAIATDKVALRPGNEATFANYTSYAYGINGIMVDLANLPVGVIPDVDNFRFHVGNDDTPDQWGAAAEPSSVIFRPGAGEDESDRVSIIWEDGAIRNQWLQVTVSAVGLGLAADDVFYFGNAVAESGNWSADAEVTTTDLLLARNNPRDFLSPAEIDFPYDYNRDTFVNAIDVLLARNNPRSFFDVLELIDLLGEAEEAQGAPLANVAWLTEFDQTAVHQHPADKDNTMAAVDKLLAVGLM